MHSHSLIHFLASLTLLTVIVSCDLVSEQEDGPVELIVIDVLGNPLPAVRILSASGSVTEGEIGYPYHFQSYTDTMGIAQLDYRARGKLAWFFKEGYYYLEVPRLKSGTTVMEPTPEKMRRIGVVEGEAIYWGDGMVATSDYQGLYRVYQFNDTSVIEQEASEFPNAPKWFITQGDTLWLAVGRGFIYAYDISNPVLPQELFVLDVGRYLGPFDVAGDLFVVATHLTEFGPIRIGRYGLLGEFEFLASIGDFIVLGLKLIDNYLVMIGYTTERVLVAISYDLSNPSSPQEIDRLTVYKDPSLFMANRRVEFFGNYGIQKWGGDMNYYSNAYYSVIDFSDPTHLVESSPMNVPMYLYRVISTDMALASQHWDNVEYSALLRGSLLGGYQIRTFIEARAFWIEEGYNSPWFLIGGYLWKLEP